MGWNGLIHAFSEIIFIKWKINSFVQVLNSDRRFYFITVTQCTPVSNIYMHTPPHTNIRDRECFPFTSLDVEEIFWGSSSQKLWIVPYIERLNGFIYPCMYIYIYIYMERNWQCTPKVMSLLIGKVDAITFRHWYTIVRALKGDI